MKITNDMTVGEVRDLIGKDIFLAEREWGIKSEKVGGILFGSLHVNVDHAFHRRVGGYFILRDDTAFYLTEAEAIAVQAEWHKSEVANLEVK